ncbi:alpha/beta fold hydrolase [Sphingomonadaceae bacterium G21617-S1]|nr:alpha/beta fold hydrolase [Sphingomonadaceae bacterium G21617-S1]
MTDISGLISRSVTVHGTPLSYHELGQGDPLVLIHGGGPGASGISNYRRNVEALAAGRRVIVVDLPGYGNSPSRPIGDGLYDTFAEAMLGLLDALQIERASFVGNSLGGGTTLSLALTAPDRVDKMVLMGPGGGLPLGPFPTEGLLRMLTFYDGDGPSREKLERVLDLLVFDRSLITPDLVDERYAACIRPDVLANPPLKGRGANPLDDLWRRPLYSLTHPTLILWGREDRVLPWDAGIALMKSLPNSELHIFPQTGHWVQWERHDQFNQMVANFLDRPR